MSDKLSTYAILLAGGSGSRLWPVSRQLYPKQLVKFTGNYSLVQNTVKRLEGIVPYDKVRVVCGDEHLQETHRHLAELGLDSEKIIISEPCGRNTAPAVLLAIMQIVRNNEDAILLVFPADHVVKHTQAFRSALHAAIRLAENGHIVTFGIKPDYPETGYGYIEGGAEVSENALDVKRFVEKPDRSTAEAYLKAGNFFWNSGMFAFKASIALKEFEVHASDLYQMMAALYTTNHNITDEQYRRLPDISIDYAIMEKTEKLVVWPSDFGWSDIGTWKALYDFLPKDRHGNVIDGDVVTHDTQNCFIMGRDRLIAANTLENVVLVETPDAVFASPMEKSRDVKSIVEKLKTEGRPEYRMHNQVFHAWGSAALIEEQAGYRVRRLVVYPEATLTIAMQAHQIMHVTVVQGNATVKHDNHETPCPQGTSLEVRGHQSVEMTNTHTEPLYLIEIMIDQKGKE